MAAPKRDRPHLPKGYIQTTPKGMLTWSAVETLFRGAPYFWIATTNADGRPHLVQQWAVWIDQQLFFRPLFPYFRYRTPVRGLYLASASAHPGAGVHGACGYNAAQTSWQDMRYR